MEVEIGDLKSTIRAVDGDELLSPPTLERIVRIVLQAVDDRDAHRWRVFEEERISTGINHDLDDTEWSAWNK
jgi:hypothetical protein